jgi:uncharacterized Zn finger protein
MNEKLESIQIIAECPHCGCKGKKVLHTRLLGTKNTETAKEFGWYDVRCGACGRPFRSYR